MWASLAWVLGAFGARNGCRCIPSRWISFCWWCWSIVRAHSQNNSICNEVLSWPCLSASTLCSSLHSSTILSMSSTSVSRTMISMGVASSTLIAPSQSSMIDLRCSCAVFIPLYYLLAPSSISKIDLHFWVWPAQWIHDEAYFWDFCCLIYSSSLFHREWTFCSSWRSYGSFWGFLLPNLTFCLLRIH